MSKENETPGPVSGTEATVPASGDRDGYTIGKGFREPLGENAIERLRSYQVMTIPPSARRALMSAELPGASPDLLHDTLPPNRPLEHVEEEASLEVEAPIVAPERKRRLRGVVVLVAAFMLVLIVAAWLRPSSALVPQPSVASSAAAPSPPRPRLPASEPPLEPVERAKESLSLPEATEPPTPPERPKATPPERKAATADVAVPTKKSPVVSVTAPPSPPTAEPASVPAPPVAGGAGGKGFRLGSR